MSTFSFMTSVTAFFMSYLNIDNRLLNSYGLLCETSVKYCCKYLIEKGVFIDKEDIRKAALKEYDIILPHCFFDYDN